MACGGCSDGCGDCGDLTLGTGPAGLDGQNSFTQTTADFTQPSSGGNVTVNVSALGQLTGLFAQIGQVLFITGGGYYTVVSSTATVLVLTNLGYAGNAAPAAVVSFPAGVSPAGLIGPTGASTTGAAGANGTTELVTLYSGTAASGTSFSSVNTVQSLPSSAAAPLFPTVGSLIRISLVAVQDAVTGGTTANHWRGDLEIVLGGVSLILPVSSPFLSSRAYWPFNGMSAVIDVVAISLSPLTLIADVKSFDRGIGFYQVPNGYYVISTASNAFAGFGNVFASGYTLGVDQTANISLQVNGRRTAVGTPAGSPSIYLPLLKVERLIK